MGKRDMAQYFFAMARQAQQHLAAVLTIARSLQKAMRFEAIHELAGAMMLDLKAFGEESHGGAGGCRQTFNGKQSLILLRLYTRSARGLLAQILKTPHFVSKFRQCAIVNVRFGSSLQGQANIS